MSRRSKHSEAGSAASPGADRRVAVRHRCRPESSGCEVEVEDKEERWPAHVCDVSVSGMGLLLPHRFEPGTVLVVEVEGRDRSLMRSASAQVIHATALPDGSWLLGCTLADALSPEELQDWVHAARSRNR